MDEELLESAIRVGHELFMVTNDMMEAPISRLGLTQATAAALAEIDPSEDPPATMKTLSQRVHCNASSLTFLIDQLRDRGLVERVSAATDGRQRAAVLTAEGRRVRAEVLRIAREKSPLRFLTPVDLATVERLLRSALAAPANPEQSGLTRSRTSTACGSPRSSPTAPAGNSPTSSYATGAAPAAKTASATPKTPA